MFHYHPPPHTELDILHQDDALLVLSKPSGLLSVPGRAEEHKDCLLERVCMEFPGALIVHRLDMSTSGLMVMARDKVSHRHLSRQFERRQVKKSYLAVVSGKVQSIEGCIELPLICDWPNRPRQIVDHIHGKPSRTDYRVLDYDLEEDTSRLELTPVTGRTHQLRVHMQMLGHPILGDDLYAETTIRNKADRLLLHANALEFSHPETCARMAFRQGAPF